MKNLYYFLLTVFLAMSFISCEESVETAPDSGYAYFPLHNGQTKIYAVDSIIFSSLNNTVDSIHSFLRETIVSESKDSDGYIVYKAELFTTKDTLKSWEYAGYMHYRKNEYQINQVIGNTTFSVFTFPVLKNRSWNKNAYNALDELMAYYSYVAKPFFNFDTCVEVFVRDDVNFIEQTIDKETYQKSKGLIYKIKSDIRINNGKKNGTSVETKFLR